jgi:hypothetical protein
MESRKCCCIWQMVKIFSELSEECLEFHDFSNAVGFILCLPGSTASVERIISIMNSIWTKEKSRLSVKTKLWHGVW